MFEDLVTSFQLENTAVRGRFIRLRPVLEAILTPHHYPAIVNRQLSELIAIGEGTPESLAAIEMIIMATGACSEVSTLEIVDSKSMTAAMETANKVVSAYQAPNK